LKKEMEVVKEWLEEAREVIRQEEIR